MPSESTELQFMVREHLLEVDQPHNKKLGHGTINETETLNLRWNSQFGTAFVDGSHMSHNLELGDEIKIDCHAPPLKLFEKCDFD